MTLFLWGQNSTSDIEDLVPQTLREQHWPLRLERRDREEPAFPSPPPFALSVEGLKAPYTQTSSTEMKPSWGKHLHLTDTLRTCNIYPSPSLNGLLAALSSTLSLKAGYDTEKDHPDIHLLAIRISRHGQVPHCPKSCIPEIANECTQTSADKRGQKSIDRLL